jgi:hypothetical protein
VLWSRSRHRSADELVTVGCRYGSTVVDVVVGADVVLDGIEEFAPDAVPTRRHFNDRPIGVQRYRTPATVRTSRGRTHRLPAIVGSDSAASVMTTDGATTPSLGLATSGDTGRNAVIIAAAAVAD